MRTQHPPPLIYVLHSGNLYGTEHMALATLTGLRERFHPLLLAPPGPVHAEAMRLGLEAHTFESVAQLVRQLAGALRRHEHPRLVATGVSHSLVAYVLARLMNRPLVHLHVVHGGTDERLSYGRKAWMGRLPLTLVAVSDFVSQRLLAHGCRPSQLTVIENFLTRPHSRQRPVFVLNGVRRLAIVSRVDPIKRVGLLFDALHKHPGLADLRVDVYGHGSDMAAMQARAASHPQVHLHGFVPDAANQLADHDLLLHTCAEEPFGLAVLEAMAARVPVLVPNAGGAGSLIENGVSGFHFSANDPTHLGQVLQRLMHTPASRLNAVVNGAQHALAHRFAPQRGLTDYTRLLEQPHAI